MSSIDKLYDSAEVLPRNKAPNVSTAHVWAELHHQFQAAGKPMPVEDNYIAAIARRLSTPSSLREEAGMSATPMETQGALSAQLCCAKPRMVVEREIDSEDKR